MDLSQFGLNGTNGTGSPLSIPGLADIQGLLTTITLVSVVLGGLFMVLYIANMVQRMRADRAMIAMHKDIAAIKELLEKNIAAPQSAPQPAAHIAVPAPVEPQA